MNIILTGNQRVGKTTALEKILSELKCSRFGFLTRFDASKSDPGRELYMYSLDKLRKETVISWENNLPVVDLDAFDRFGSLLLGEEGRIAVMDELGKFEAGAQEFRHAVEHTFDSDTPVIAVIRINAEGWMQALKLRDDVKVITVTEQNRDEVPGLVLRLLLEAGV